MSGRRIERINSLLKEVISDVIHKQVKNPHLPALITVTNVDITRDLRHAKVFVSVIGDDKEKALAIDALQSASGFIGVNASKQVEMRYFPDLKFILDDTIEHQMRIDTIVTDIQAERETRENE